MRDIVINTGPIIGLVAAVPTIEWLPMLYKRILLPFEVYQELEAGGIGNPDILALDDIKERIEIGHEQTELPKDLMSELDTGEASVIHIAKINGIDTVAIDEKSGRRLARIHGLKVTGSLGILLKAKKHGLVSNLDNCISRMRQRGVWIAHDLEEDFARQASAT